uniref:Uncharacterized protein n=1 Tax=Mycena chlorophos TaxID=658473 RepID=A0ABQ0L492_MYCCL|nr:predicted protein [Mycena chlorophos]
MAERRYAPQDLANLKRNELVELVLRQLENWPPRPHRPFSRSKTNMEEMRAVLLSHPFTTTTELPRSSGLTSGSVGNPSPSLLNEPTPSSIRNLTLFVRDMRDTHTENVSVDVSLRCETELGGNPRRAYRIRAHELLTALQDSIAAIAGPAKIGVPNEDEPSYTSYFATFDADSFSVPRPEFLFTGRDAKLHLVVGQHANSASGSSSSLKNHHLPKLPTSSSRPRVSNPPSEKQLAWLRAQLAATQGSAEFEARHNKRLSNLHRAQYWKFASDFSRKWQKERWPSELCSSSDSRIRKHAIENALKLGPTALNQAINMAQILDSAYFGVRAVLEVVQVVENETKVGEGEALVEFLTDWAKAHPDSFCTTV